jgi:hypothetical protein
MMRRPERPLRHEASDGPLPGHRGDHRRLVCLRRIERREQPGDGPCEQGLARSWRPDHEQRVATGERDLERAARLGLAADVREVRPCVVLGRRRGPPLRLVGDQLRPGHRPAAAHPPPADELHRLPERRGRQRLDPRHEAGLVERVRRHHHASGSAPRERRDHGQQAWNRPDLAAQPQLPEHRPAAGRTKLLGADEDRNRDPEIQGGARLRDVRRGEVHRDAAGRMDEAGIPERTANPLAGLPQRRVREADDGEAGQSGRHAHLDADRAALEPAKRGGEHGGEHGATLGAQSHPAATRRFTRTYRGTPQVRPWGARRQSRRRASARWCDQRASRHRPRLLLDRTSEVVEGAPER